MTVPVRQGRSLTAMALMALAVAATPAATQEPATRIADEGGRLAVLIGPMDVPLPAAGEGHGDHGDHHGAMVFPPVSEVVVPFDAWVYAFRYEIVDAQGNELPNVLLHHLNIIDPRQRDLFLPISYRVAAMGGETGRLGLPRLLFGHPLRGGQRLVVSAMLHNPTETAYEGVTVRFIFEYVKTGRPWPLFPVYTFQMDVMFPAGDKDFDLPPGRSTRWWQGSPAVAGRILGVGGHVHDHAEMLVLENVTTGDTIWIGRPILAEDETLTGVTIGRLYRKLGVEVSPDQVYRATVVYQNPTGAVIPKGGMGLIAGVFMPSGPWPRPDVADALYQLDQAHYLREVRGSLADISGMESTKTAADHTSHGH
jgi:hypothetical protein